MIKKFTRHGNSFALVVDKPILDLLNIDPESAEVEIRTDGRRLIVEPRRLRTADDPEFDKVMEWMYKEYGKTLKKLAQ